jgi:23S rRNA (guanine2445-N2)-methyltransferase / 23S rRNA (guanine2069-N7)-methyltransferase
VSNSDSQSWFATCPKGLESLLAAELDSFGADSTRETVAGVYFAGQRALAYRACLWSRLANRILWPLAQIDATDGDIFYQGMKDIKWGGVFDSSKTIAIDFSGENRNIRNTQFGAQRSKDAIVDWFVATGAPRPSVDRANPDVRLNVFLVSDWCMV